MSSYDQAFRTAAAYDNAAKWPYMLFSDQELGSSGGYVNNSLEGLLFDQNPPTTGTISIPSGLVTPDWYFYNTIDDKKTISSVTILDNECTVICSSATGFSVGDVVSVNGVRFDSTHPFVNGSWVVKTTPTTSSFTFDIIAPDASSFTLYLAYAHKNKVFEIRDDRQTSEAKGYSFTSVLFTPKEIHNAGVGYKRILPSDLYTRFRFQTGSDAIPKGGINSNLFNTVDSADNNIKPVLWAYFFGYNSAVTPGSTYEIAFNSHAIVLRPSGEGSKLEFALVKFNWGLIPAGNWMASRVGQDYFNSYTISGTDLGYLISTNPEVGKTSTFSPVLEIAKSDSFTYDSEFAARFNLKITIRKHLLSDSLLDGTYLVNLMVNDDYDVFGPGAHYDSILHAYIDKPEPLYNILTGSHPHDCMLMPMMYFKFNNTNEQNVGVNNPTATPPLPGSSKIVQDSLFFRQINAVAATSYLY